MAWKEEDARRYEGWFLTPQGRFALGCESRLMRIMTADWHKRRQKLLEIGCGSGIFLDLFFRDGFDVYGIDKSEAMVSAARRRLGKNADVMLGDASCLPYGDDEFDFCALITVLEFCEDPGAVVREAVRVAKKGVLIGFLNRWSLYYLMSGRPWPWSKSTTLSQANWLTWPEVRSLVRRAAPQAKAKVRSVLPGPKSTWRDKGLCRTVNAPTYPYALGAFTVARFDLKPLVPFTPIGIKASPA